MAKEWYLLSLTGYDNDLLGDYAEDGFLEILDSMAAIDVELYNYDLSERQEIRAVIQNRTQDTKLNSLTRLALVPIGTFKAGMYIKYDGRFWLIVGVVDNNGVYEKGVLAICNYQLTWINADGDIIQRWANVTSASQYNNGETSVSDYYFYMRSDQLLVLTPDDDESLLLDSGVRFIIDRRCSIYEKQFDDSVTKSTDNPLSVYELTRSDTVLYDYQDSGHYEFLATQCEKRADDGYYLIDGVGYWLCENPQDEVATKSAYSEILYDEATVYIGLGETAFIARFYDVDGNVDDSIEPSWTIAADYEDKLIVSYVDNSISIATNDESLINKSFELFLNGDGYEIAAAVIVTIKVFI